MEYVFVCLTHSDNKRCNIAFNKGLHRRSGAHPYIRKVLRHESRSAIHSEFHMISILSNSKHTQLTLQIYYRIRTYLRIRATSHISIYIILYSRR